MPLTDLLEIPYPGDGEDPFLATMDAQAAALDQWIAAARENGDLRIRQDGGNWTWSDPNLSWSESVIVESMQRRGSAGVDPGSLACAADTGCVYMRLPARPLDGKVDATLHFATAVPADPLAFVIGFLVGGVFTFRPTGEGGGADAYPTAQIRMMATGPVDPADSGAAIVAVLTPVTPTLDMVLPAPAAGLHCWLSAQSAGAPPGSYAVADFGAEAPYGRYTQSGRWARWPRIRLGGGGDVIHVMAVEMTPGVWRWFIWEGHGLMVNDATPAEVWAWEIPTNDITLQYAYDRGNRIAPAAGVDLDLAPQGATSVSVDLSACTGDKDGVRVVEGGAGTEFLLLADAAAGGAIRHSESVQSHDVSSAEGYGRGEGAPNPNNPHEWSLSAGSLGTGRPNQVDTVHGKHLHSADAAETLLQWDIGEHNKAVVGRALVLCATNAIPCHVIGWEVTFGAYGVGAGAAVVSADAAATEITNSHGDADRSVAVAGAAGGAAGVIQIVGTGKTNDAWSVRLDLVETTVPVA